MRKLKNNKIDSQLRTYSLGNVVCLVDYFVSVNNKREFRRCEKMCFTTENAQQYPNQQELIKFLDFHVKGHKFEIQRK